MEQINLILDIILVGNKPMIFEEFLRWWLLELNNIVKPMSEPTMPNAKIYYFDSVETNSLQNE